MEGPNRLIREKSPYLLQHAHNPVDWFPWGNEAFDRAFREDKPVFLSIGYATCHWCHVMAHESFEHPDVAAVLNEDFVSIKVDREERPDIDGVYMEVCQHTTGHCGWPLTIIMTPDKKPFFAGTYLPRDSRFGMTGLIDLLHHISSLWKKQRTELVGSAERIVFSLQNAAGHQESRDLDKKILDLGFEALWHRFDSQYGGFGTAPKFPAPFTLLFLMRYWKRTGSKRALAMVEKTLSAMSLGGIHDHLGGGFHRYATDAGWRIPHFEKMLYDQALLLMAYTEAFQATRNPEYRINAEEIIAYVTRDLMSPDGAFFSAEDADSPGGEGAYYLWTFSEVEENLGSDGAESVSRIFNITKTGNYPRAEAGPGRNILFCTKNAQQLSDSFGLTENELHSRFATLKSVLFTARQKRPRPMRDEKILTDWNALFIAALAQAARVFGNGSYEERAKTAMTFIVERMRDRNGGLLHRYCDGEAAIGGFCDDYAFMIRAALELYETTFEWSYLKLSIDLNDLFLKYFWDAENGGFWSVSDYGEALIVRKKEIYDGAIPSGNSVAFDNLVILAHLIGNTDYEKRAQELMRNFAGIVKSNPSACSGFLCAADRAFSPGPDVVIVGKSGAPDTAKMVDTLRALYLPAVNMMVRPPHGEETGIPPAFPFLTELDSVDGKATAYICFGRTCTVPTTDPEKILEILRNLR